MHPDIDSMMPSDQSQIFFKKKTKKHWDQCKRITLFMWMGDECKCEYDVIIVSVNILSDFFNCSFFHATTTDSSVLKLRKSFHVYVSVPFQRCQIGCFKATNIFFSTKVSFFNNCHGWISRW